MNNARAALLSCALILVVPNAARAAERIACPPLPQASEEIVTPPPSPWAPYPAPGAASPELALVAGDAVAGTAIPPKRRYQDGRGWQSVWTFAGTGKAWATCRYGTGAAIAKPMPEGLSSCRSPIGSDPPEAADCR